MTTQYAALQKSEPAGAQIDLVGLVLSNELRGLYRRPASKVHPDRASHDADRARRTKFMAEVNDAYRERNLDRLLELEQRWYAGADVGVKTTIALEPNVSRQR